MTTTIRIQPSGLIHRYDRVHCFTAGTGILNPFNQRFCLLRPGTAPGELATLADFIAAEVPQVSGYQRQVYGRIIDSVSTGTPGTITVTGHGLTNGIPVFLIASDSATVPTGLALNTKYWIVNASADTVQLATTIGGSAIAIFSTGSGSFALKVGARNYSDANNRVELDNERFTFVASGGQIAHQGFFTLWGAAANANIVISTINATSDQITTSSAHVLATGDAVMITADVGTQPAGTSGTTIYYARVISSTVVTLHPTAIDSVNNSNTINIADSGTGTIRLRYANGAIDQNGYGPQAVTIGDTQIQRFQVTAYVPNTGIGNGV
jgi:hypothetical protein